ncbi:MAG: CBS domain-containing protein [Chloroflexota bacterium]|jgi:CBS domain-containing protein
MILRDIMTTKLCCVAPSDSLSRVASEMKRHNVGVMPVCENEKLIGLITDRDIVIECVAAGSNPKECKVADFMSSELICGTPEMSVAEASNLMASEQIRRLPVVEGDRLIGMVSLGDLALHTQDNGIVAQALRGVSMPVRSFATEAVAA